nr:heme-binding protein [Paenibacillus planticolens]
MFGGGIPLSFEGRIVGAVGASGSTVANDIEVSKAAVRAFETYPKARIGSSGSLL